MQDFLTNYHLPSLLKASWQAAVLILLVLASQWAFGRRLSPSWRYGLWLLVAVRLALPWTLPSSVSLFNVLSFTKASAAVASLGASPEAPGLPASAPTAIVPADGPESGAGTEPASTATRFTASLPWLLVVWLVGAVALAASRALPPAD